MYVGGSKSSETSRISPQIYDGIIPNLYRVCKEHFLIRQCCQNDAVRSKLHDVIVWWRHATVTRSKKRPKSSFLNEVKSPTVMFNVAVILEIIMHLTKHHRDQLLSKYAISIFLPSLIAQGEPFYEKMRKFIPKTLIFHTKNWSYREFTEGTDLAIVH